MTLELGDEGNMRFGLMVIEIPVMSFNIDKGGPVFLLQAWTCGQRLIRISYPRLLMISVERSSSLLSGVHWIEYPS